MYWETKNREQQNQMDILATDAARVDAALKQMDEQVYLNIEYSVRNRKLFYNARMCFWALVTISRSGGRGNGNCETTRQNFEIRTDFAEIEASQLRNRVIAL